MRILIHSNAPMVPTGYGLQTRLLLPRLAELGHDVAVSALYGVRGAPITWEGFTIFPAGQADFGADVVIQHAQVYKADLVLTLMDFWKLLPIAAALGQQDFSLAAWMPIDCTPIGTPDKKVLGASRAYPIAMSRFGQRQLTGAGHADAPLIPHAVDLKVFQPPEDREKLREEVGVADRFVVGICAANNDAVRKAFPEQLRAFARFAKRHKDAVLMLHTLAVSPKGFDLFEMIEDFGIKDRVLLSDQYVQVAGLFPADGMAAWYGSLDVLSNCSYGEGFGIPVVEAQACGVPVVVTDNTTSAELVGSGWKVKGQEFWNAIHRAWWVRPDVDVILRAYERAYKARENRDIYAAKAVEFAARFDTHAIAASCWKPLLEKLEGETE